MLTFKINWPVNTATFSSLSTVRSVTGHFVRVAFLVSWPYLFHVTSPPFVSATSPKYVDRESLEGRRTGTKERKGTSPEMFVAAVMEQERS